MSARDSGGPAFPQHGWTKDPDTLKRMRESGIGMTLRDWFAGNALQAYLAGRNIDSRDANQNVVARTCYSYADAMLAARNSQTTTNT